MNSILFSNQTNIKDEEICQRIMAIYHIVLFKEILFQKQGFRRLNNHQRLTINGFLCVHSKPITF